MTEQYAPGVYLNTSPAATKRAAAYVASQREAARKVATLRNRLWKGLTR